MSRAYSNKKIGLWVTILVIFIGGVVISTYQPSKPIKPSSATKENKTLNQFITSYQKAAKEPWPTLNPKQILQVGVTDESVVLLRKRLQLTGDLSNSIESNQSTFDEPVKKAVALFQERHGLNATGIVDKQTLAALSISPKVRLKQLKANLNRWSDFEKKQKPQYLWINIPAFQAQLIEDNQVTLKEPVIVGKPSRPTPEMFSEITDVMLNPYWIVPPSLAKRGIIPKASQDLNYLKEKNIRIFDANNHNELALDEVDTTQLNEHPEQYFFRQEPGPANPLGHIKYKITNSKAIFLHDTNTKALFEKQDRALSSGCIRMQNPFNLLSKIMAYDPSIEKTENDINALLKAGEPVNIKLNKPLPVLITYITAWVDDKGKLNFRDDIYKQDIG